jgi:hypothetical protein
MPGMKQPGPGLPDDKQAITWFPRAPSPATRPTTHPTPRGTIVNMAVGAAIGTLLFATGHRTLAIVAWVVGGVLGGVSFASPRSAAWLARALAQLGRAVGTFISTVLLGAVFLLVLTPARGLRRLGGADDLHLRPSSARSFWLDCDPERHKRRYARAMFATELRVAKRAALVPALGTVVALIGIAEIVLRTQGFGPGAIVYVSHPLAGYYPAPNQKRVRYGGRIETNQHGMRAPDFAPQKPPGTFRILMLGDSTLWGGSYVDQEQLYARLLEARLNQAAGPGRRVEVLNMGVNGWGPFHESGFVEAFGTFGADLVLVCLPHDDVDRERYSLMSTPFFHDGTPPLLALEEVAMHAMWRYRRSRVVFSPEWRHTQRLLGAAEYERLVLKLREGAEVFFEILPSRTVGLGGEPDVIEQQVVERLIERMGGVGILAHYPKGLFKDRGPAGELYHDEAHLHRRGHAVYSEFLVDRVTSESDRFKAWMAERAE